MPNLRLSDKQAADLTSYLLEFKNDESYIGCLVSHNGYEKNFSCTHKREIYLDLHGSYLFYLH